MMQWMRCVVYGKVQHVYYRKFVSSAMRRHGFEGYVRNLEDGTVECVVFVRDEAEREVIEAILLKGSPMSKVDKLCCEVLRSEPEEIESEGFVIL